MKKLLITLLALLLCALPALAEDEPELLTDGAYEYYLTEEGAVITWYKYAAPVPEIIEIPATLGGYPVVALEDGFANCTSEFWDDDIQRIVVPEGVKSIGNAFMCCGNVQELVLPASLTEIPEGSLYHVNARIIIHPDNPCFTCADGFLIDLRTGTLLYVVPSAQEKPLPEVRRLGMNCLYNWDTWEKDVVLPATVEEIGPYAFYDTELNSVTLNEGLKRIENAAFSCMILTTPVEIPASVELVEWGAFAEPFEDASMFICRNPATRVETYSEYAERIVDNRWVDHSPAELFEYYLTAEGAVVTGYAYSEPLPEVIVIPPTLGGQPVIALESGFATCYNEYGNDTIQCIVVPEGVKYLGDAFVCCPSAKEIVLPASLESIAEGAFSHACAEIQLSPDNPHFTCEDGFLIDELTRTLLYVTPSAADKPLPAVLRLGDCCLDNWHAGEAPVLPETLTSIGAYIFSDCVDVARVEIPASVTEIGAGAFNCCGLTEITLPAGLTEIRYLTFSCTDLTEITIPEGVTRIEEWAFYLVPLTRVEIPASVALIEYLAFDPEVELVLLGDNTHLETEEEYDIRTSWDE